jgi:hypothetical protein
MWSFVCDGSERSHHLFKIYDTTLYTELDKTWSVAINIFFYIQLIQYDEVKCLMKEQTHNCWLLKIYDGLVVQHEDNTYL